MQKSGPELHIVTFAVPFPANYGGAIDVWNRIAAVSYTHLDVYKRQSKDWPLEPEPA